MDCTTCFDAYYKTAENTCFACESNMPGCTVCSDSKTCTTCSSSYYKFNYGDNTRCIINDAGCETGYTATDVGCTKCKQGSYLEGNKCMIPSISNCALTNRSGDCLHCEDGFFYASPNCTQCSRLYPGCKKCTDATTCVICEKGFRLNSGTSKCEMCP